jgi:uncharacterized membrane protein
MSAKKQTDGESEQKRISKRASWAFKSMYRQTQKNREKRRGSLRTFILISICGIAALLALIFGLYLFVFHGGLSADHFAWGSFGSYAGGILGPAFSLLSFIAVVVTLSIERRRISEEAHIAELRHTLDVIDERLKDQKTTIGRIMEANADIEMLGSLRVLKACLAFMSYCIDELDRSADAPVITAYYSAIYGAVVKRLRDKGSIGADVYRPFRVHEA